MMRGRHASMRPRVFPAEDKYFVYCIPFIIIASMRPRVFPAEDRSSPVRRRWCRCFNEAAGIPRGRHQDGEQAAEPDYPASMRPRVFPAEDVWVRHDHQRPDLLQ